jgi:hydroxypyruvate reductase
LRAAALQAVDPAEAVRRYLTLDDLAGAERVFVVGLGKAGVAMARAALPIVGPRLAGGVLAVPHPPASPLAGITVIVGGHPTPNANSLVAGRTIVELLAQTTERDLVLALISGGGSALAENPHEGITLADLEQANAALLQCGATIQAINRVRQRLSQIKGGQLVRHAAPARVLALILSDIIGNPLDLIASGPTVPAPEFDVAEILDRYALRPRLPSNVLRVCDSASIPNHQLPIFDPQSLIPNPTNRLIASNALAGAAAAEAAHTLGFTPILLGDDWHGEARATGQKFAQAALDQPGPRPLCVIAGGETTVTVRGAGRGGRNQEAALAAAFTLAGHANIALLTLATDGVDGPTDAAGAFVTGDTLARAPTLGLDPHIFLANNDSYPFFRALGDLLHIGPTGTNVNDLWMALKY